MYQELQGKGMELIAVNSNDDRKTVNDYISKSKFTFKVGMEDVDGKSHNVSGKYGVQAYPTNYVIGPDGKVAYRGVGYNEQAIREALKKLGVE